MPIARIRRYAVIPCFRHPRGGFLEITAELIAAGTSERGGLLPATYQIEGRCHVGFS